MARPIHIATPKESLLNQSRNTKMLSTSIYKKKSRTIYEVMLSELKFPTTTSIILSTFPALSEWHKQEIALYPQIYYMSKNEKGKDPSLSENDGEFKVLVGDDVAYRYEIIESLGKGTFGQVLKVFDHKLNQFSALKIIKNKPRYLEQALVEVEILKFLQEKSPENKQNFVKFESNFTFRNHIVLNI